MKALAMLAVLAVVLGLCLPAYGEILIYKENGSGYNYERVGSVWQVEKRKLQGYLILDVTYEEDGTISFNNGLSIMYGKDEGGNKWFEADELDAEIAIERLEYNGKVEWLVSQIYVDVDFEVFICMLAGKASLRDIGTQEKREVSTKLKGHYLEYEYDDPDGDIDRYMEEYTLTLHSVWTKYANTEDDLETEKVEGLDGDYDDTVAFIKAYLQGKGYLED